MLITFASIVGLFTALYGRGCHGLTAPSLPAPAMVDTYPLDAYHDIRFARHQLRGTGLLTTNIGPVDNPCMTPQMPHAFCANTYDTLATTSSDGAVADMKFFTAQLMTFAQTTNTALGAGATDTDDTCLGANENVICCNSPSSDTTSGATNDGQAAKILSGAIEGADTSSTGPDQSHDSRSRIARRDTLTQVFVNQPNIICSMPMLP